jgi:hypothetical protein
MYRDSSVGAGLFCYSLDPGVFAGSPAATVPSIGPLDADPIRAFVRYFVEVDCDIEPDASIGRSFKDDATNRSRSSRISRTRSSRLRPHQQRETVADDVERHRQLN